MATPSHKPNLPFGRQLYGLFIEDGEGPLCKGFFASLEEAKIAARRLAEEDRCQYSIFALFLYVEVARISPSKSSKC